MIGSTSATAAIGGPNSATASGIVAGRWARRQTGQLSSWSLPQLVQTHWQHSGEMNSAEVTTSRVANTSAIRVVARQRSNSFGPGFNSKAANSTGRAKQVPFKPKCDARPASAKRLFENEIRGWIEFIGP